MNASLSLAFICDPGLIPVNLCSSFHRTGAAGGGDISNGSGVEAEVDGGGAGEGDWSGSTEA